MKTFLFLSLLSTTSFSFASPNLINGKPVGDLFQAVGTFDVGCTITKVGDRQFITAAHCVSGKERSIGLSFKNHRGKVKVRSLHLHPSWLKDCTNFNCTGKEVGGPNMTPGRADVAFFNVAEATPSIPVIAVNFHSFPYGTEVAMVGGGCTRGVEPEGRSKMRYAITKTISAENLNHQHSLYKNIAEITGQADWVTPGYGVNVSHTSLCPGDSGGPLLTRNAANVWEIVGIAADYTFDGPYRDGNVTVTNLHTRLDDESFHNIGGWIRDIWEE